MPRWRRPCSIARQKNFECGYTPDEIANARKFVANPDWGAMLRGYPSRDRRAQEAAARSPSWASAWAAPSRSSPPAKLNGLSAAVCYYGGQIAKNADEKPKVPTLMHFGEKDPSIPMTDVEIIKQKRGGDSEIFVYRRRAARLPLRRARQLPRCERQDRLAAHHGLPEEASEEVRKRVSRAQRSATSRCAADPDRYKLRDLGVPDQRRTTRALAFTEHIEAFFERERCAASGTHALLHHSTECPRISRPRPISPFRRRPACRTRRATSASACRRARRCVPAFSDRPARR